MSRFVRDIDFSSLGVIDLLEAREHYHVHLANLEHVVGTAIGRYRIRRHDPNFLDPEAHEDPRDLGERTLANSGVRPWSWPCVLVFVDQWQTRENIARHAAELVPPRLYLPDGRVVPTCVLHAPRRPEPPAPLAATNFPSGLIGGGFPLVTEAQGAQRIGSVGCLVTDGYYTYALTSEHVVGEPGNVAYVFERGERKAVAASYRKAVGRVLLQDAWPGLAGIRTYVNIDAGLFRIDDLSEWTSQVFGIGRLGPLIDLNADTLNLDLIGCPLWANGGASGILRGEVQALFYRYRAVGGFDYVADLLIGPRDGEEGVTTRPGDSGTVWFWDEDVERPVPIDVKPAKLKEEEAATAAHEPDIRHDDHRPPPKERAREYRPIATQWGGHSFLEPGGQAGTQFALATSLASVCRLLDVELVRDHGVGHSQYWGKVGHYKIALSACSLVASAGLASLLGANATLISVSDDDIANGNLPAFGQSSFVALADVADLVWRSTRKKDEANHFADMDEEGAGKFSGKTLLALWDEAPENRKPEVWTEFYTLLGVTADKHRGALPFRVRQIYEEMVGFVGNGELASFVCAAGLMAHYVGDACQPLHASKFHHGRPGHPEESNVHSFYETTMLDRFAVDVVEGVNASLSGTGVEGTVTGGAAAADLVVRLMQFALGHLDPEQLVIDYVDAKGPQRSKKLWEKAGKRTIDCLSAGAICLADLWVSAWREGGGEGRFSQSELSTAVDKDKLMGLYNTKTFLESAWLKHMSFG